MSQPISTTANSSSIMNSNQEDNNRLMYLIDGFWRTRIGDQQVHARYPLMAGGPVPVLLLMVVYVYFVRRLGPRLMQSREPFDLKWPIRLYNVGMSALNLYGFVRVALLTRFGLDYFSCRQLGTKTREDNEILHWAYVYFATKLFELLDTVFFVLRKKYNQTSNLHVFHHSFMTICVWLYFKIAPAACATVLFPFINAGVHALMYGYYFLATFEAMQKHLWWKRHLTQVQMVQFVVSMVHFVFLGLSSCGYPLLMSIIGFAFNFVFLTLFYSFYNRAYLRTTKPASSQQHHRKSV